MEYDYLNWIDLASDFLFIITNYFLILFSDFIIDPSFRNKIGYQYIWSLLLCLGAISFFVIYIVVKSLIRYRQKKTYEKKLEELKKMLLEKEQAEEIET